MSETNQETNLSSVGFIDRKTFDTGMHFCEPLEVIVSGRQYRETRKLPARERELRAEFDDSDQNNLYAEDRIVVVDGVDGHNVSVSDLYQGADGELVSGKPRPPWIVTPEGWFIPEGLVQVEEKAKELLADMAQLVIGYLSETDNTSAGVTDLVERTEKKPQQLKFLQATPPTEEEQNRYYG